MSPMGGSSKCWAIGVHPFQVTTCTIRAAGNSRPRSACWSIPCATGARRKAATHIAEGSDRAAGALIPSAFALRGVSQAVAQPAVASLPEVRQGMPEDLRGAVFPMPTATESGRRIDEGDELGDVNRQPIAIRCSVD